MTPPLSPKSTESTSEFDAFAADYDAALEKGIALSGEHKDFFIDARVRWLKQCLVRMGTPASNLRVLDYGCGTGSAFGRLRETFSATDVAGVDVSVAELAIASKAHPWARVFTPGQVPSALAMDVAYSNGTFHHIPPSQRAEALQLIHGSLKPGGFFALWENNPWNPGTRWVMSRIPFDRDAITLSAPEARRMVRGAGFKVVRTDFWFIFPRFLAPLRALEGWVSRMPLGAQYQVLCRKI